MSVAVTTCVSEDYQHFVPLWAWCLNRAYPEYAVKVFLTEPALPFLRVASRRLDVQLIEGEFGPKRYERRPRRFAAWCRYLLFTEARRHHWRDHDWVYITDGDLMVVREEPPLHVQHLEHMKVTGLCYSNLLRDPLRFDSEHMTGLHFCGREFIEAVTGKCTEYDGLFRVVGGGVLDGKPVIHDERLLYQIVRDSGLPMPPLLLDGDVDVDSPARHKQAHFRCWHGLNVGRAMVKGFPDKGYIRAGLPWWKDTVRRFAALAEEPGFWQHYAYLTPSAKRALGAMCRLSGYELRKP